MKAMSYRRLVKLLGQCGCTMRQGKGDHEKWYCPDGDHMVPIPHSQQISPGVLRDVVRKLACLPEGWLR